MLRAKGISNYEDLSAHSFSETAETPSGCNRRSTVITGPTLNLETVCSSTSIHCARRVPGHYRGLYAVRTSGSNTNPNASVERRAASQAGVWEANRHWI